MIAATRPTSTSVTSPEHESWNKHRQLMLQIPRGRTWRGCVGLALMTTHASSGVPKLGRFLVPDRDIRWINLIDVPPGHFRLGRPREVHLATVRRTKIRFGMPTIGGEPEVAFDFRFMPFGLARRCGRVIEHGPDVLDPSEKPRLFRILNALNWAMTSTAIFYRATWQANQKCFLDAIGETRDPDAPILLFGEGRYDSVARPAAWMPRPYLAFKQSQRHLVFDWSTRSGLAIELPYYSYSLRLRLCEDFERHMPIQAPCSGRFVGATRSAFHGLPTLDLIFENGLRQREVVMATREARILVLPSQAIREGDLVASDGPEGLPEGWHTSGLYKKWVLLRRHVHQGHFHTWVRLWFERQFVTIRPGLVHVSSELAALAAKGHALAEGLHWDLLPALEYYHETVDGFIFPTLRMRTWWDSARVLPGEVAFDLTPTDPRFIPHKQRANRSTTSRFS